MNQAALGRRYQGSRYLDRDFQGCLQFQGPVPPHQGIESFAFHQLHRAIAAIGVGQGAEAKYGRYIGMPQGRGRARFTQKTFPHGLRAMRSR